MKKTFTKRLISIISVMVLLLVPVFQLTANAQTAKYPRIHVSGFMCGNIYADKNNPNSEILWPPQNDKIISMVKSVIPDILEFTVTRNWDKLGKALVPAINSIFTPAALSPDGSVTNGSGVYFVYPSREYLSNGGRSDFHYDWRQDPLKSACELNDYINYVLDCTGAEKVVIDCHSLGGVITLTYCTLFGHDKVDAICFNTTAVFGQTYTGELLLGKLATSNDAILSFLDYALDTNEKEETFSQVLDLLDAAGIISAVSKFGNKFVEELNTEILNDVLCPLFGRWPTIWAMARDEDIDAAMEHCFKEYFKPDMEGTAELKATIENYNNIVRANRTQTLLDIDEDCKVGVISRHGYCSVPVTPSWDLRSDGVVDARTSSFGATMSRYGKALSDAELEGVPAEYISPDKTINAQTCLFPEKTWFIKYAKHDGGKYEHASLINDILYSEEELTCNSKEEYPRFMIYNENTNKIEKDQSSSLSLTNSFRLILSKIRAFFENVIIKIKTAFGLSVK